ncbi:P-loop containing nucleoside triphosphate hydrolase protein [Tothia fuscella]|uniref:P-loop containing nucleoside triphosphate hydrolase protein n=1 Tax=Tothia fuscella TaxID=1048955 RepID=A0A9P4U4Q4_9PEZI|nr:P-loop containing nucleoside triphosphate hydrolase protein [Tothia fuscella]
MGLENVKHIILVLSGKGGVGKSSITTQLALTLSLQGRSVGVLDVDLTGPNIPRFFGIEAKKVTQAAGGLVPVVVHEGRDKTIGIANGSTKKRRDNLTFGSLSCMSLGFILSSRSSAVIWRGPKKTAMVRQFLTSTLWPANLDYLLIDTPPGTSDEHISLLETLLKEAMPGQLAGAVVVTTPQAISTSDVKKELNFCVKTNVKVLGIVENMSGFVCPHCRECTNVFSKGGGEVMAREFGKPFLGSVPIDPAFVMLIEEGKLPTYPEGTMVEGVDVGGAGLADVSEAQDPDNYVPDDGLLVEKYTSCSLYPIFDGIVKRLVLDVEGEAS